MLDYGYDAAMLKKKHLKKDSCLRWNWLYANKLKPFYDASYDINQITWIHRIDVTLQLVSAQKEVYASEI